MRFWLQTLQPAATHNDESHASWCVNNGYPVLQILTCTLPNIDQPIIVSRRRLTLSWLTLMKRKGHPLTFNAPYIYSRVGSVPCKMYLSLRIACTMEGTRLWTWHSLINKSNEGHGYSKVLKTFIQWVGERYEGGDTAELNVDLVKRTNTFCFLSEVTAVSTDSLLYWRQLPQLQGCLWAHPYSSVVVPGAVFPEVKLPGR